MKKNGFILSLATLALAFAACNRSNKNGNSNDSETPTFKTDTDLQGCFSVKNGIQSFTISAEKGAEIKTNDGAILLVGPETFVDKNGKPVTGKVSITYKAMNTPAEIVASGIPMTASNKGNIESFVSDGMFDIQASTSEGNVQIAQGKNIEVYTEARDKNSSFQYWYFDNKAGNWIDIGDREGLKSKKDVEASKEKMGLPNAMAFIDYIQQPVFSFSALYDEGKPQNIPGKFDPKKQIIDIKFNKSLYPEFAPYSKLMWQYAGTDASMDPANNRWIYQSAWQDVKLTPKTDGSKAFDLTIKTGGRTFSTIVKPVVTGEDLKKAEELAKTITEKNSCDPNKKDGANVATLEANMYNAFAVNRLGTYNCDRFYSDASAEQFEAEYDLDGKILDQSKQVYFLIDEGKNVISYNAKSYKLKLNPKALDAIFIVAAQGVIAAVPKNEVAKMRNQNGGKIKLFFQNVGKKITNLSELSETINGL